MKPLERGKSTQMEVVRWMMSNHEWWTLEPLLAKCRDWVSISESALTARIRDLRKEGHTVLAEKIKGRNTFRYKLVAATAKGAGKPTQKPVRPAPSFSGLQGTLFGGGDGTSQGAAPAFSTEYPD